MGSHNMLVNCMSAITHNPTCTFHLAGSSNL